MGLHYQARGHISNIVNIMNRYQTIPIKNSEGGKRVTRSVLYPPIPRSARDIYVLTTTGDRLDLLAYRYYQNIGYWWIIAEANGIGKGTMSIPAGLQLRIPVEIQTILGEFQTLNQNI